MSKVLFAEQLRGLAALLVVASHLYNVYPIGQTVVAPFIAAPPLEIVTPWLVRVIGGLPINLGPFGVGVFFLVSGFVIPFSLRRHGRFTFLLARGLRIYPTYWGALGIGAACVWASARYWGLPVPFGWSALRSNALLVHTLKHVPTLDLVNWTLVVELHFYLFAALARPWILRGTWWPMLAAAAGAIGYRAAQAVGLMPQPSFLEIEAMSLPYMLIGTAFHHHFTGAWSLSRLGVVATALAAVSLVLMATSGAMGGNGIVQVSYAAALVTFGAAYAARRWTVDLAVLRWLARISFPLYAVHVLAGFTLMTWLIAGPWSLSYTLASIVALVVLLLLAWLLHYAVERWSIAAGSRLARLSTAVPAGRAAGPPGRSSA